jgi:hypothetical protein
MNNLLIHQTFRQDLVMWSWENGQWDSYDSTYLQQLKRHLKAQLQTQFGDIRGKRFKIVMPRVLRKQIPLFMAIWDLGGVLVIDNVVMKAQGNPLYAGWFDNIDYCLIERGDIEFGHLDEQLCVFADRTYELDYFFLPDQVTDEDVVVGKSNNPAFLIITSGSIEGPENVFFTHDRVLLALEASKINSGYKPDEHILHVSSLHHGSLCINYLLPTLQVCQNHYFKITHAGESVENFPIDILGLAHIDRMLWVRAFDQSLINSINVVDVKNPNMILQCAFSCPQIELLDQLFATNKIQKYIVFFGCSELPIAHMKQEVDKDKWTTQRTTWNTARYQQMPSNYWQYKENDIGLALKSADMDSWFQTADQFQYEGNVNWIWHGRTTQIKRGATTVIPEAIQEVLNENYKNLEPYVVADYQFKKVYVFVFSNQNATPDSELLEQFNSVSTLEISGDHTIDLVVTMHTRDMFYNNQFDPTVLRFLARKQLCLR